MRTTGPAGWPNVGLAPLLAVALAGCAPLPPERPALREKEQTPVDLTPGFQEREPDTCKAAGLTGLIGQPSGMVRTVAMPGPYRIIAPGQVVDQDEYRSDRVDIHTDAEGVILRISCG